MSYTPDTLTAELAQLGYPVTKRRLLDWVHKGLLPHPRPRGRGQGRGKTYAWTEADILHRAVDVADLLGWHRRARDLFLPLWVLGYDVPLAELRVSLGRFVDGLDAGLEAAIPLYGDRADLVSDLLAMAEEQRQAAALPAPLIEAFLSAVVHPAAKDWPLILEDLQAALVSDGEEGAAWPEPRGTATLVVFIREQLSVARLREIAATASGADLAQVRGDLRRVVQSVRAVAHVGLTIDPWVVTRVLVQLGLWAGVADLGLRRAGRGAAVDRVVDRVVEACQQVLTNPRLRLELQQFRAQSTADRTDREEGRGAPDAT